MSIYNTYFISRTKDDERLIIGDDRLDALTSFTKPLVIIETQGWIY